jgi:hypothetical protein
MSGRKKQHRAEASPTSGQAEGVSTSPPTGKKRGAGRAKPASPSGRWPALAIQAAVAGVILGVVMVSLSLISVATSDGPGQLVPQPSQASGANPGVMPTQAGATVPAPSGTQGVDPQRLELRTKGDPQAPVVVTEWFDFL